MANCSQSFYEIFQHQKADLLLHLLTLDEFSSRVLVFVRSRDQLHALTTLVRNHGLIVDSVSGTKKPELREKAIQDLQSGTLKVLLATESILRDAVLTDVRKVIHFDPHELDRDYLTQLEFASEEVITLITQDDRNHLRELESLSGSDLKKKTAEDFRYDRQPRPVKAPGKKGHVANKTNSKPLQNKKPKLKNKGPRRKTGRTRKR